MNVYVKVTITANSGGTFVMSEEQALLLMMSLMVIGTIVLNFIVVTALFS